jgi:hypothetical protein
MEPAARSLAHQNAQQILEEVHEECGRQVDRWGVQSHADGTSDTHPYQWQRDWDREQCDYAADSNCLTWRHILQEEVSEAFAEQDPAKLRAELIQAAAVVVSWIRDIDVRA